MSDTSPSTPTLEAVPPPARRLSRAGVVAITAVVTLLVSLAAIWATRPSAPSTGTATKAHDERSADPIFLNTPPRRDPAEKPSAADDPVLRQLLAEGNASRSLAHEGPSAFQPALPGKPNPVPSTPSLQEGKAIDPDQPIGIYRGFNPSPYTTLPSLRPEPQRQDPPARWRAAFSSPLSDWSGSDAQASPTPTDFGPLPPPPTPAAAAPSVSPTPAPAEAPAAAAATRVPKEPRELSAGTVLSAILLTTIHTDNAAPAVAQISLDVRDRFGRILIPRGSRLVGSYGNALSLGDRRIAIAWDRLIVRGHTYQFPGLPGVDLSGAAGVRGDVNNHTALVFGRATLLSLIGAGAKLSQPTRSRASLTLTDREVLTSSVADQLNAAAVEYLNRAVNIAPTITVPAGTAFKVLLPYNLTLSPPEATR